jgi:hypothetical protein
LFSGKLLSGTAFSLIQSLGIGRDDTLILLVNPSSTTLETLTLLDNLVQIRFQCRHLLSRGCAGGSNLFLGRVEAFQLTLKVRFVRLPLFHLFLRNIFHGVELYFEHRGSLFSLPNVSFQLQRTLLLSIFIGATVKASIKVVEFFPDLRDDSFVIVLCLLQAVAFFV